MGMNTQVGAQVQQASEIEKHPTCQNSRLLLIDLLSTHPPACPLSQTLFSTVNETASLIKYLSSPFRLCHSQQLRTWSSVIKFYDLRPPPGRREPLSLDTEYVFVLMCVTANFPVILSSVSVLCVSTNL